MNNVNIWLFTIICSLPISLFSEQTLAQTPAPKADAQKTPTPLVFNQNRSWNPSVIKWQDKYWECANYNKDGSCESVILAKSVFGEINLKTVDDESICDVYFDNHFSQTLSQSDFKRYAEIMTERNLWNETDIAVIRDKSDPVLGMSLCGLRSLLGQNSQQGANSQQQATIAKISADATQNAAEKVEEVMNQYHFRLCLMLSERIEKTENKSLDNFSQKQQFMTQAMQISLILLEGEDKLDSKERETLREKSEYASRMQAYHEQEMLHNEKILPIYQKDYDKTCHNKQVPKALVKQYCSSKGITFCKEQLELLQR